MLEEKLLCHCISFFSFLLKYRLEFLLNPGLAFLCKHKCCPVGKFAVIACLTILQALRINHISFVRMLLIPGFGFGFLAAGQ
ncbi:hypothetical protein KPSB59_4240002 [Klebsiella quasipneumoniae subsp. quasipneumoniae]|nr:hypothetical protein KPSB59_4240002 [Klebsiella quasipneumoniae subsp. quasipneumoniae]